MIHRVFAYGSNMHVPDLRAWMERKGFSDAQILGSRSALLHGWELVWDYRSPSRLGGAANVRPNQGKLLPGVVLDLDQRGLDAVDRKEGHPGRYDRTDRLVDVHLPTHDVVSAWLYVVTDAWREPEIVPPRRAYLKLVIEGALTHDLPEWHVEMLRCIETEG